MLKIRHFLCLCAVLLLPVFASATNLVGIVQNVDADGNVTGWAYDKDNEKQNVEIQLYAGPLTTPVAKVTADNSHPVMGSGPHWFWFKLPPELRPAHGDNLLYVYAVAATDPASRLQLYRAGTTTPYVYGDLSKAKPEKTAE